MTTTRNLDNEDLDDLLAALTSAGIRATRDQAETIAEFLCLAAEVRHSSVHGHTDSRWVSPWAKDQYHNPT